jgi:Leucine-rich repeat (LRR) protein
VNHLNSIPDLNGFSLLTSLILNDNQLTSLDELNFNAKLRVLEVSYNRLQSLPSTLYYHTLLQRLVCRYNKITSSVSLHPLLHLTKLDVAFVPEFDTCGKGLEKLTKLQILDVILELFVKGAGVDY